VLKVPKSWSAGWLTQSPLKNTTGNPWTAPFRCRRHAQGYDVKERANNQSLCDSDCDASAQVVGRSDLPKNVRCGHVCLMVLQKSKIDEAELAVLSQCASTKF
jgi:hypothetical protein